MPKRRDTINYVESTYVFGEDEVALEVPVRVLALADAVCEGAVGLVPVHAHVARRVVDQVVHVVPQLPRPRPTRCFNGEFLGAVHLLCYVIHFRYCNARWKKREKKQKVSLLHQLASRCRTKSNRVFCLLSYPANALLRG